MTRDVRSTFGELLQTFFSERLLVHRHASPRTVASYRDTFKLFLRFAERKRGQSPAGFALTDIDAPLVLEFLEYLERERRCSIQTRNLRMAAIRSFMKYAAVCEPTALPAIGRVLAIPTKRCERRLVGFLSRAEMEAVIAAPNIDSWSGHRDSVMLTTFYNTGARVSEIVGMRVSDAELGPSSRIRIHGKGRKERVVPLWKATARALRKWLSRAELEAASPLFPNRHGAPMTRSGVEDRLAVAVGKAAAVCPSLARRKVSPHILRHTTAMHLLQSGVDITVIALWLGHESPTTTHRYLDADLALKEKVLHRLKPVGAPRGRYRASDSLMTFLERL